ncbi:MAG: hypothetical protein EZS28_030944 [Streblomastix strix]|uniref:Uncharacterized protein n=1 Tax=Streblomastix strix TaxID=222440 RepID=A0A5J4USY0_9EUKA|nr:MAG: hypothetical protein EZS28_030944 [Streblomastix strix]
MLTFDNPPSDWINQSIIERSLKDVFNGSRTNAGKGSVLYIVSRGIDDQIGGVITLSKLPQEGINRRILLWIVIGSAILIAMIIVIIIIVIGCRKKSKHGIRSNTSSFRDSLGSYRSI